MPFQNSGKECDLETDHTVIHTREQPSPMHPQNVARLGLPQSPSWLSGNFGRPIHNDPAGKLNHQDAALEVEETREGS